MSEEYTDANISGEKYEQICGRILKDRGFSDIRVTPQTKDYGIDIIAQKDGLRYAIQCKYYSDHKVGPDSVQQAYTGKDFYHCDVAAVMTNNTFTQSAITLANSLDVKMWANVRVVRKETAHTEEAPDARSTSDARKNGGRRRTTRRIVGLVIVLAILVILIVVLMRSPLMRDEDTTADVVVTEEDSGYILPDSDSCYLTESDLAGLTKEELRLARNEIYARHGYIFEDAELQAYFESQSWYHGTVNASDFDDSVLNAYEQANLKTIQALEK